GISIEEAANILKSQLSIEEKVRFADYLINNEKSVEETRALVEDLWRTLRD
ncbi:MAG: dephospho-CoA kinase, partial [Desulfobacterales bacterium]|nr:dephospho-CoA kinase [Desulfobacterales bacterium]